MKHFFFTISILCALTTPIAALAASSSSAPSTASDRCSLAIEHALAREVRVYRTMIFGKTKAKKAKIGATRYDGEGNPWIKTDTDTWRTAVEGFRATTWTDDQMDNQEERDPLATSAVRKGILETKGVLTSELIPPMLQSFRALRCRAAAVCANARKAFEKSELTDADLYELQPLGCIQFKDIKPLFACQLGAEGSEDRKMPHRMDEAYLRGYCEQMATQLLDRETAFLKLTVSYDAAYRSLLQFAGHFDRFLAEFQSSLLLPIRQAVTLLGNLHKIPCFLSQCDE